MIIADINIMDLNSCPRRENRRRYTFDQHIPSERIHMFSNQFKLSQLFSRKRNESRFLNYEILKRRNHNVNKDTLTFISNH